MKCFSLLAILLKALAYNKFQFFFTEKAGGCDLSESLQLACDKTASDAQIFSFQLAYILSTKCVIRVAAY